MSNDTSPNQSPNGRADSTGSEHNGTGFDDLGASDLNPPDDPNEPVSDLSNSGGFISSDGEPDFELHPRYLGQSMAGHTEYFVKALSEALDSAKLDESLVLQAQLSGHLNKKTSDLAEKHAELVDRLLRLKALVSSHFTQNRIGQLEKDIASLAARTAILTHGHSRSLLFGKVSVPGVAQRFPIEYNQAKDKVLERPDLT